MLPKDEVDIDQEQFEEDISKFLDKPLPNLVERKNEQKREDELRGEMTQAL